MILPERTVPARQAESKLTAKITNEMLSKGDDVFIFVVIADSVYKLFADTKSYRISDPQKGHMSIECTCSVYYFRRVTDLEDVFLNVGAVSVPIFRVKFVYVNTSLIPCRRAKHMKGSKERSLLGQDKTGQIFGVIPFVKLQK